MKFKWEKIYSCASEGKDGRAEGRIVNRAKVYGGWLINTFSFYERGCSESTTFIFDPNHQWGLDENI